MATVTLYYGVGLYSNRIIDENISKADTVRAFKNINFIQGNGIDTTLTINEPPSVSESPSYLTVDYEDNSHLQLWFVISCYKQNARQITLTLRRDFLTEYWKKLEKLPFLCDKASTIPDSCKDAQYKKTMNLSQIKKKEILLKDNNYGEGWFVFYLAKPKTSDQDHISGQTFTDGNTSITFCDKSQMTHTITANYDVFAIPVGGNISFTKEGGQSLLSNLTKLQVYRIAQMICLNLDSNIVYDIQYLPFIPESVFSYRSGYAIIKVNNEEVGFGQILDSSEGSIYLPENDELQSMRKEYNALATPLEKRKYEEKHMFRLSSPNYQSSFEFSLVKNGIFPTFSADIALKPYNPYIYVYPSFSGLYGSIYHDGRGMILSGDFSVDRTEDAWQTYQLNNKNYESAFNRQIQSMDLKNSISMKEANWNIANSYVGALTGTASGAAAGAMAGTMIAPGIGTVVGAIAGGASSLAGGVADVANSHAQKAYTRELNDDARDNAIQQFQYQIGNIQALPNTLTKVSAINPNYKVYPVLEVYECTEQESANLDSAIRYNGIDINIICKLSDFSSGYVQGSVLYFPPDLHLNQEQALTINEALQSGRYIKEV